MFLVDLLNGTWCNQQKQICIGCRSAPLEFDRKSANFHSHRCGVFFCFYLIYRALFLGICRKLSKALMRPCTSARLDFSSKRIFASPNYNREIASLTYRDNSNAGACERDDPHGEAMLSYSKNSSMRTCGSSTNESFYQPSSHSPSESSSQQIIDTEIKERHESQLSDPKSVDLDEIIRLQQEAVDLRRKGYEKSRRKTKKNLQFVKRGTSASSPLKSVHKERWQKSIAENWRDYLATKPAEFVASKRVLSLNSEAAKKGTPLFEGIRVDEHNSADMKRIFSLSFEAKIRLDLLRCRTPRGSFLRS
jgi:hypothetical protein